jgi:hypothetical protein
LGLQCQEHVKYLLNALEDASHANYLFNDSIDVPGGCDGHDLLGEAADMNFVLMKCNLGLHLDLSIEEDMVMIY